MSYLDLPRISFVGSFYTDPSTVDNDPSHYDPSCTDPSPWQDPGGSHYFAFNDLLQLLTSKRSWNNIVITGVLDANGALANTDPLFGSSVTSVDNNPVPAKLVDLDPYQQGVSTIYGFQLVIKIGGAKLIGTMDPATLNSCRFDRVLPTRGWQSWDSYGWGSFGGDSNASGVFQSVLRISQSSWPAASVSPVLAQLRQATSVDAQGNVVLSIRLTLDGYQNVSWHSADFRIGRVVGNIGPYSLNEPTKCVFGRWMNGRSAGPTDRWDQPSFYGAPFKIAQRSATSNTIVIDLSNGLATQSPGSSPIDLQNLTVQIGDGSTGALGPFQANDSLYNNLGGIIELSLTPAQYAAAANSPVSIVTSRIDIAGFAVNGKPTQQLWQEDPSGLYIAANDRVLRLTSDVGGTQNQGTASIYVTQWGQPASIPLYVMISPCFKNNGAATVPWAAGYAGDTAQAQCALQAVLQPGSSGCYPLQLSALKNPGSRTPQLDGQLYFIVFYTDSTKLPDPSLNPPPPQEQMISCVVWAAYTVNENPPWSEVEQLMTVYNKLFPSMHAKVDLCDQVTFNVYAMNPPWSKYYGSGPSAPPPPPYVLPNGKQISSGAICWFMTRGINDPSFMPIMRDLSPNKLVTVLYYCYNVQQAHPPGGPPPSPPPQK
jgi:hypothetical protein